MSDYGAWAGYPCPNRGPGLTHTIGRDSRCLHCGATLYRAALGGGANQGVTSPNSPGPGTPLDDRLPARLPPAAPGAPATSQDVMRLKAAIGARAFGRLEFLRWWYGSRDMAADAPRRRLHRIPWPEGPLVECAGETCGPCALRVPLVDG